MDGQPIRFIFSRRFINLQKTASKHLQIQLQSSAHQRLQWKLNIWSEYFISSNDLNNLEKSLYAQDEAAHDLQQHCAETMKLINQNKATVGRVVENKDSQISHRWRRCFNQSLQVWSGTDDRFLSSRTSHLLTNFTRVGLIKVILSYLKNSGGDMSHPGRQQCSDHITDSFHSFDSNALWVKGAEHEHLQVFFM